MKILVVCHGNVARSQLAELAFCKSGFEVQSAGVKTKDGRPMSKKMRMVARERGYDVAEDSPPRSTALTTELLEWADLVFYMDNGNEKRLPTDRKYRAKYRRLSDYNSGTISRVPDPNYHADLQFWRDVTTQIEEAVSNFLTIQEH